MRSLSEEFIGSQDLGNFHELVVIVVSVEESGILGSASGDVS